MTKIPPDKLQGLETGVPFNVLRRGVIQAGAGAALASIMGGVARPARAEDISGSTGTFDDNTVIQIARRLAGVSYQAPDQHPPGAVDNSNFDQQ